VYGGTARDRQLEEIQECCHGDLTPVLFCLIRGRDIPP
jgi:hypothetical protein